MRVEMALGATGWELQRGALEHEVARGKQRQATAARRVSFGKQATLRGCDGHAHYPLVQRTVSGAQRTVGRAHCPCWEWGSAPCPPFLRLLFSRGFCGVRLCRVLLPLLIQLDRFHHSLSGMAETRDVSRYRGEFFQLIACRQRTSLGALGGTPQNSLLSAAFAQRWSSSQSGSKFEHSCAHWRPRVVAGAEIRAARPHREA